MRQKNRVRLIYAATAMAVLGMAGGFVMASVLTSTAVNQSASFYQGGNNGVVGYTTPTLAVATVPASIATCTSGTVTGSTSGATQTIVLSNQTGSSACATGDFAEEFVIAFSATITTQTNSLTITTQVGAGAVQTNSIPVTLGTGTSSAFTQTLDLYVDYGAVNPPATGISVLDLMIQ